jgi:Flp pilus assembly protein TadB
MFICSRIKTAKTEDKKCHAKTMRRSVCLFATGLKKGESRGQTMSPKTMKRRRFRFFFLCLCFGGEPIFAEPLPDKFDIASTQVKQKTVHRIILISMWLSTAAAVTVDEKTQQLRLRSRSLLDLIAANQRAGLSTASAVTTVSVAGREIRARNLLEPFAATTDSGKDPVLLAVEGGENSRTSDLQ